MNKTPQEHEIGVNSIVVFPQGEYVGGQNNAGGTRYHQGAVDTVFTRDGVRYFTGHHLTDAFSWSQHYRRTWELPLEALRMSPNAIDVLMACQEMARGGGGASAAGGGGGPESVYLEGVMIAGGGDVHVRADPSGRDAYAEGRVVRVNKDQTCKLAMVSGESLSAVPQSRIKVRVYKGLRVRADW